MEAVNIVNNFEEDHEECVRESPVLLQSVMLDKILQSENGPDPFFKGLIFAVPISLLMWGFIIWAVL
jgi:hypothetical protein